MAENPHEYVETRLSAYIDGQLSDEERARVRGHLQECATCRASLETMGWTVRLLKQVAAPRLPRQFTLPVEETRGAPAPAFGWLKWGLGTASVVVAAAFVLLLSVDLLSRGAALSTPAPALAPAGTMVGLAAQTPEASGRSEGAPKPPVAPTAVSAPAQAMTAAPQPTQAPAPKEIAPSQAAKATLPVREANPTATLCKTCGGALTPQDSQQTPVVQAIAPPRVVTTGTVDTQILFVRAAPSSQAAPIGSLRQGDTVEILMRDKDGGWLEILFPLGNRQAQRGWIAAEFVKLPAPINSLPTYPTLAPASATPAATPTPATPVPSNKS